MYKNTLQILTLFLLTSSCADTNNISLQGFNVERAVAVIHPTSGNQTRGIVLFAKVAEGVKIDINLSGLSVGAAHGFHIHTYGDARADNAVSAGGHYNPHNYKHAEPSAHEKHVGDLGNIISDQHGNVMSSYIIPSIDLDGPYGIVGRSVIIHAGEDDFTSQPSGAAGARIAQGVIGIAK